jgi:hypothetical protein
MKMQSYQKSFEHLENLHRQMKAVLEWKKFKIEERNINPSLRLPFYDTSVGQLADLKSKFFSNSIRLRNDLEEKHHKLPDERKHQLINKLTTLEKQAHYLGSNIRVL